MTHVRERRVFVSRNPDFRERDNHLLSSHRDEIGGPQTTRMTSATGVDRDSLRPRFAVEAHLARLFVAPDEGDVDDPGGGPAPTWPSAPPTATIGSERVASTTDPDASPLRRTVAGNGAEPIAHCSSAA